MATISYNCVSYRCVTLALVARVRLPLPPVSCQTADPICAIHSPTNTITTRVDGFMAIKLSFTIVKSKACSSTLYKGIPYLINGARKIVNLILCCSHAARGQFRTGRVGWLKKHGNWADERTKTNLGKITLGLSTSAIWMPQSAWVTCNCCILTFVISSCLPLAPFNSAIPLLRSPTCIRINTNRKLNNQSFIVGFWCDNTEKLGWQNFEMSDRSKRWRGLIHATGESNFWWKKSSLSKWKVKERILS